MPARSRSKLCCAMRTSASNSWGAALVATAAADSTRSMSLSDAPCSCPCRRLQMSRLEAVMQ